MKFTHGLLQRRDSHIAGRSHPLGIARYLREHDDRGIARRVLPDRGTQADVGLNETVVAPFSGTMQEEDRRPARLRGIIRGDVDLVAISSAADRNGPIEESG